MAQELEKRDGAKRVLIYRIGSLGDTVVALPSFYLVSRAFPNAERRLLTNFPIAAKAPSSAAVLEGTGLIHGYFRYSIGMRNPIALLSLWWQIVRWRPDVLVYMSAARGVDSARRDRTFFRLCGIRRMVGVPLTEDMQANRTEFSDSGEGTLEFEARRLARNLSELGDARLMEPASWDLRLTDEERRTAVETLLPMGSRPFVAVSLGTKVQANEWEEERWRALLKKLATAYPGYGLVLTGARNDFEKSEYVASGWREVANCGTVLNLCGRMTPRESACVFASASVFIGHDSGPMHLAAAVQIPCVAIFSARGKPRTWFPFGPQHRVIYHQVDCWGCNLDTCIIERKKCMTSIEVDEVLSQVRAALG
jgi:ADP-heptose:LPS heptosyltransferase